jgi:NADP-dependent 3-hydroxy acid dehydrogenase YdfG
MSLSYLITGAGRGLGLELTSQLSQLPSQAVSHIFAITRQTTPSDSLQKLMTKDPRIIHITIDITDRSSVDTAVIDIEKHLNGKGLDVLINNAGIMQSVPEGGIAKMDNLGESMRVNVDAVQNVIAGFLPLLKKGEGKKIVNM